MLLIYCPKSSPVNSMGRTYGWPLLKNLTIECNNELNYSIIVGMIEGHCSPKHQNLLKQAILNWDIISILVDSALKSRLCLIKASGIDMQWLYYGMVNIELA